ncbi:MAG: hypothetical protein M3P45_08850 [Acidobacteriota bacterium]|nr:hypothetical protein [Acidobacteriota bacterium]
MLSGFWARPTNALRLTFDPELFWADSAFACIDPRQQQRFRFQAAHTPASWISLGASFDILEHRSNMALVNGNTLFLNPNTPVGPLRYAY